MLTLTGRMKPLPRTSGPRSVVKRLVPARPARIAGLLALLGAVSLWLSGCAGTARGIDQSVYQRGMDESQRAPAAVEADSDRRARQAEDRPEALVVLRYPAMIHADAESLYVSSFAVNAIGGEVPYTVYGKPQTERIAQSVIAKSSYFAMSLYRELKERLPEGSVLLSPHIIVWDEERKLHSRPILASEQVPAVLTVDFTTYSFPDVEEMMDSPPVTFGDLVTPLLVVRSGRWARPPLEGLLVASEPLVESAWRLSRSSAERQLERLLQGQAGVDQAPLDFIAFLAERDPSPVSLPVRSPGAGAEQRAVVERYPLEKIQMNGELLARMEEDSSVDPFAVDFAAGASARIVGLLEDIDHGRATFFSRQAAVARFDPELGKVFFVRSTEESVRARLQLAEALVAAERRFLAAQSDSIYAGTFTGDFGVRMRKIIAAEHRMLEERRRLARKQNLTTAVAALALAGAVYGATVTTTASSALVASLSGVSLLGSVWAANTALETRSESEEVNEYFIARMAPSFERQMSVQMEWLESKELITARGFAEFRNKTLSLYQSRVRSMSVQGSERCSFSHPTVDATGLWYGECHDGYAVGSGYGLARDGGGRGVEFLGDALDGRASGAGAMILRPRGTGGPRYYEGEFRGGLAHGVLRVEALGEEPRLRLFRDGEDQGRGDPAGLREQSFASTGDRLSAGLSAQP